MNLGRKVSTEGIRQTRKRSFEQPKTKYLSRNGHRIYYRSINRKVIRSIKKQYKRPSAVNIKNHLESLRNNLQVLDRLKTYLYSSRKLVVMQCNDNLLILFIYLSIQPVLPCLYLATVLYLLFIIVSNIYCKKFSPPLKLNLERKKDNGIFVEHSSNKSISYGLKTQGFINHIKHTSHLAFIFIIASLIFLCLS